MKREELDLLLTEKVMRNVKTFIYYKCRDLDLAMDILQDTYEKAVKNCDKFDGKNISGWLKTISRNLLYDRYKKKTESLPGDDIPTQIDNETPEQLALQRALLDFIEELKPPLPEIIKRRAKGETSSAIGEALGLAPSTIREKIQEAKEEIRINYLGDLNYE